MRSRYLKCFILGLGAAGLLTMTGCQRVSASTLRAYRSSGVGAPTGLIYSDGGELWIGGDAGQSRLLAGHDAALPSPDLKRAVYYEREPGQTALWVIDVDTQARRQVAIDKVVVSLFGWVGEDIILLGTRDQQEAVEGGEDLGHLTALKLGTGEVQVLDPEDLCASLPAVSPDGQRIAYSTFKGARLYQWSVGPQAFDTVPFPALSEVGDLSLTSPAWSPDGHRLAWIVLTALGPTDDVHAALLILDLQAHTAHMLHTFLPRRWGALIPAPSWSPDGRWLALVTNTHEGASDGAWLIASDGSREMLLTEDVMAGPFWSSEGQLVWNDGGVWRLDLETRNRDKILPAGQGFAVGWARS